MFCKACEYPLWNIASRQCPECGRAFKPSEFDFRPRSVRFCCPHCRQHYFGTGARGHLMPSEFDCVSCGTRIAMDEMVLLPAEGWKEEQTRAEEVPWLKRKKVGFFRAWFGTIAMAMTHPGRLIRALPVDGQSWRAFWFALMTNFCFMFVGIALGWVLLIVLMVVFSAAAGGGSGGGGAIAGGAAFATGLFTLIPLLFFALLLSLWAIAAHGLLRLTGPTRYGPLRTFDAVCYANGANILMAIPCFGVYFQAVAWIWPGVSATIMLRETHGVSGWRAAFAVFLPPIAAIGSLIALMAVLIGTSAASAWRMQSTGSGSPIVEVAEAVKDWARDHNGEPPRHVVQLVEAGKVLPFVFVRFGSPSPAETMINGVDIQSWYSLASSEHSAAVERVLAVTPTDTVAHRVGRMVFTYHGMTFPPAGNPSPDLWVGVQFSETGSRVIVVEVSGMTRGFKGSELAQEVEAQNAIRAAESLPALPDLASVSAAQPATADPGANP